MSLKKITKVCIAYRWFDVSYVDHIPHDSKEILGKLHYTKRQIEIKKDIPEEEDKTLLHEILHAALRSDKRTKLIPDDLEEDIVQVLELALGDIVQFKKKSKLMRYK